MKKMVVVLFVNLFVLALLTSCRSKKETIDLTNYITVEFSGFNGSGEATIDIDEQGLAKSITEALVKAHTIKSTDESDYYAAMKKNVGMQNLKEDFYNLSEGFYSGDSVTLDKDSQLSNGDTVTVTLKYDNQRYEKANVQFSGEEMTVVVSGLQEVEEFDAFKDVDLQYTGYSSYGDVVIDAPSYDGLTYYVEKPENLSNGDIIEISVASDYGDEDFSEYASVYGKKPKSDRKQYTVSGLPEIEKKDVFENLKVSFTGISPKGQLVIDQNEYDDLYFFSESKDNLKNGDKITIQVEPNGWGGYDFEDYAKNKGIIPLETTKEYTVEGLREYLPSLDSISNEMWEKWKKEMEDQKTANIDFDEGYNQSNVYFDNGTFKLYWGPVEDFHWDKAILLTLKEGAEYWGFENKLYIVYSCSRDEENFVGAFYLENVVLEADGDMLIPSNDISYTTAVLGEDQFIKDNISGYRDLFEVNEMELDW